MAELSRRLRLARGNIAPIPPTPLGPAEWSDPLSAVERLREWAERHAVEAIGWYLADKRVKRWSSRLLRAAAVVLVTAGGLAPLVRGGTNEGYVLLALAAVCLAFDHFFGLSTGWM